MSNRERALLLRLEGKPVSEIAAQLGITKQRVQQLVSPPKQIRAQVVERFNGACASCGITVGNRGHVHHKSGYVRSEVLEDYNDPDNLQLLCASCHRLTHTDNSKIARKEYRYEGQSTSGLFSFIRKPSILGGGKRGVFNIPPEVFELLSPNQRYEVCLRPVGSLVWKVS